MKNILKTIIFCFVGCGFSVGAQDASQYPQKTAKIVAPRPGSGTDLTARVLATQLAKSWKQAVTIENKPGGSIGIAAVINSAPAAQLHHQTCQPSMNQEYLILKGIS
jgi:tripartite-type tricarboxylate transporter receptor subunit TctC